VAHSIAAGVIRVETRIGRALPVAAHQLLPAHASPRPIVTIGGT